MATTDVLPAPVADGSLAPSRLPTPVEDGSLAAGSLHLPAVVLDGSVVAGEAHLPVAVLGAAGTGGFLPTPVTLLRAHLPVPSLGAPRATTLPLPVLEGLVLAAVVVASAPSPAVAITAITTPVGTIAAAARSPTAVLSGRITTLAVIAAQAPRTAATLHGATQGIVAKAPSAKVSVVAAVGVTATIAARAPSTRGALTAVLVGQGTIGARAPGAKAVLRATRGGAGAIKLAAFTPKASLTAFATITGVLHAPAPLPLAALAGGMGFQAVILASAPFPRMHVFAGTAVDAWTRSVVTNTLNSAVTEFENYAYDSFAQISGTWYAAGSDGIYELDSNTSDDGAPIAAYFETGAMDFKSEYLKRLESLYAAYRTSGDVRVTVKTDEGKSYVYNMKYDKVPTLKQRRVDIGKGLKGKYWQLRFDNVNGSSFGFDTFNALAHETVRRIGV